MKIKFEIRPNPRSPNKRERAHWTVRHRAGKEIAWKVWVGVLLQKKGRSVPKFELVEIHAKRYAIRLMDRDNFIGSLKPVIDGLVTCKVIGDDDPQTVHFGTMEQIKVRSLAEEHLEITVEERHE